MLLWQRCAAATLAALACLSATAAPAWARAELVRQGPKGACRDVALTFDTEFAPTTQALANLLDELKVRSTWFFLGEQVERYPALVRQVAARAEIGNHTYTHPVMPQLSAAQMRREIDLADAAIARTAGVSPRPLFRPPYGEWNNVLLDVAEGAGYGQVFLWSIDTRDWTGRSAESIREHVMANLHPGAIVLQHGSPKLAVDATRLIVGDLRARGYQFLSLSELMDANVRKERDFGGDTYTVQYQDTWAGIGACHNISGPRLAAYNGNPDTPVGYLLQIPHRDELVIEVDGQRPALPIYGRVLPPGHSVAPVRLAEHLGAQVSWDGKRVTIRQGEKRILITPGDRMAQVDEQQLDMGVAAVWANDRVLIPVRFLGEQLGYTVTWNNETWVASLVRTPPPAPPPPAPPTPAPEPPPETPPPPGP